MVKADYSCKYSVMWMKFVALKRELTAERYLNCIKNHKHNVYQTW